MAAVLTALKVAICLKLSKTKVGGGRPCATTEIIVHQARKEHEDQKSE